MVSGEEAGPVPELLARSLTQGKKNAIMEDWVFQELPDDFWDTLPARASYKVNLDDSDSDFESALLKIVVTFRVQLTCTRQHIWCWRTPSSTTLDKAILEGSVPFDGHLRSRGACVDWYLSKIFHPLSVAIMGSWLHNHHSTYHINDGKGKIQCLLPYDCCQISLL